jgi:hypothetical protein
VRHIVCTDVEATLNILDVNKKGVPFSFDYVYAGKALRRIESLVRGPWNLGLPGISSDQQDEFEGFAQKKGLIDSDPSFAGQSFRPLRLDDFAESKINSDFYANLLKAGCRPEKLGHAVAVEIGCGEDGWHIHYEVRKPYFVFAHLTNASTQPMRLEAFTTSHFEHAPPVIEAGQVSRFLSSPYEESAQNLILEPGQSVLIPEGVILGPVDHDPYFRNFDLAGEVLPVADPGADPPYRIDVIGYLRDADKREFLILDDFVFLEGIEVRVGSTWHKLGLHRFDPEACYYSHRIWMVGSCPHVFMRGVDARWQYGGEILRTANGIESSITQQLVVPPNITEICIVECEFEVTYLTSLKVRGTELLFGPTVLRRGESLSVSVDVGDSVHITGWYEAEAKLRIDPRLLRRQKAGLLRAFSAQAEMVVCWSISEGFESDKPGRSLHPLLPVRRQ